MALWSFVLLKPKPVAKRREGEEAQDSHTISKAKNPKPAWRHLMLLRSTPSCEAATPPGPYSTCSGVCYWLCHLCVSLKALEAQW